MTPSPSVTAATASKGFKMPSITVQVTIALILGVAVGLVFPDFGMGIQPLATIFLHLIKMLVGPLIFATLVVGIAGSGGHKAVGRMGLKAILYFEVATTIALVIGLVVANLFKPGAGVHLVADKSATDAMAAMSNNIDASQSSSFWDVVVHMFPTSVFKSLADGDILQIVVFAIFFALALAAAGEKGKPILKMMDSLTEVMFKFVGLVMTFAPMGVFAAIAATVGQHGFSILVVYAKLVGSLYFALALFVLLVFLPVCWLIRVPFLRFMKAVREPFLLAFSTASSESALPQAMQIMERFGVPKSVVSFVMPTGYTFNLDGSTLYLALTALFVAQMAGIELTLSQQIMMMLTLMLTSKGVAGVPRGAIVILAGTLTSFGLPLAGVAVLLGIDQILDMGRTSINLLGNCVATAVVARWEGVFDDERMAAFSFDGAAEDGDAVSIKQSIHNSPVALS